MQAFLKMRDPTWELMITMKNDNFEYMTFIQPLGRLSMINKNLACQMPNLAHFWHFLMLANRAVLPLIKVDQVYKDFQNLFFECQMCQNVKHMVKVETGHATLL